MALEHHVCRLERLDEPLAPAKGAEEQDTAGLGCHARGSRIDRPVSNDLEAVVRHEPGKDVAEGRVRGRPPKWSDAA